MNYKSFVGLGRTGVKTLLSNSLKLAGWKLWLALKIYDSFAHSFVYPFINKKKAQAMGKKTKEKRIKLYENVKKVKTTKDLVNALKSSNTG